MRGFGRHLFTVCSSLSLALCLAVCAAWLITLPGPVYFGDHGQYALTSDRMERSWCRQGQWCIGVRLWPLVLSTSILPALRWHAFGPLFKRRQRRRNGFCPACGYDLRATPERCPECGRRRAQSSRTPAE